MLHPECTSPPAPSLLRESWDLLVAGDVRGCITTLGHEGLKDVVVGGISRLSQYKAGRLALRLYTGAVQDGRLAAPVTIVDVVAGAETTLRFPAPVTLADGWDKKGTTVAAWTSLGFGGGSIGTVTRDAQPGNPRPRLFGYREILNCLGFNSPGAGVVEENLAATSELSGTKTGDPTFSPPVGVSVGLNKNAAGGDIEEIAARHAEVASQLYEYAHFFTLGISSPNTPGLRELQTPEAVTAIVKAIFAAMDVRGGRKPLFIKIDPDSLVDWQAGSEEERWDRLDTFVRALKTMHVAGVIAVNTTNDPALKTAHTGWGNRPGGLSGQNPAYHDRAVQIVRRIRQQAGHSLAIGGVGGVHNLRTFLNMIEAGADFVQLLSALPASLARAPAKIHRQLLKHMRRNNISNFVTLREIAQKAIVGED